MTVEPQGDQIVLVPQDDDELCLVAGIVEAIRAGGFIHVGSCLGEMQLEFDGDSSQKKTKRRKGKVANG